MTKETNTNLALCIPTYNGAEKLKKSLPLWIEKLSPYGIPIYISNNASTDETEQIVKEFQRQYEFIFYETNETNIGPDKNFEKVLGMPDTEYRWLMGDDDKLVEGEINLLLDVLQKSYDAVVLNALFPITYKESIVYTNADKALFDLGAMCTFMSILIFNKRLVESATFKECYSSEFSELKFCHLAALFSCLANDNSNLFFCSDMYIVNFPSDKPIPWADKAFDYFCNKLSRTMQLLPDYYSKRSKLECPKKIKTQCWNWKAYICYAVMAKIAGKFNVRFYRESKANIKNIFSFGDRIVLFLLALSPRFVVKCIWYSLKFGKKVIKNLFGKQRKSD